MRRRHAPFRAVFWLAATCWLAAGPGGVVVRAVLACRHAAMQMQDGDTPRGAHMPQGEPCFCTQMAGGFDQVLSVSAPAAEPAARWIMTPVVAVTHPSLFPLPLTPALAPETPPPIVA
jgi:hypothetical protein